MKKNKTFKQGERIIYNNETRTIYAIYPDNMVSLCLIDNDDFEYLDVETDELVNINEITPLN
jgi:hypothetical protein